MHLGNVAFGPALRALFYGVRFWISVCLALYIAYALQLDNPFWAGTSAAVVCQPHVGAALRKGWFRMVGTVAGGLFILMLTACLPQREAAFLSALALWVGASALMASLFRNFMSYAAALAGYTAVIIAADVLGAVGGASDQVFFYVYTRTSEICIGIVVATVVLAATDMGGAPRRLATQMADIATEIIHGFARTLSQARTGALDSRTIRRELIRRVVALEPVIDEALGESSRLRALAPVLYAAVHHMVQALASWRTVCAHLIERADWNRDEARALLLRWPSEMQTDSPPPLPSAIGELVSLRERYRALASALRELPAATPSSRLLAVHTAQVLSGVSRVLNGMVLLGNGPVSKVARGYTFPFSVADWLPGIISATRATLAMGAVELWWVATAWPNGTVALTFVAVGVCLFGPREELAFATVARFMAGVALSVVCAAIAKFALLPGLSTFAGLSLVLGVFLVPLGALSAQGWRTAMFTGAAVLFTALLAPENQMNYDTRQFYNNSLAILVGLGAATLSFRLLPPLSTATRSRRLLALTRRDLRRIAVDEVSWTAEAWQGLIVKRLLELPVDTQPLQLAQMIAALSVGLEVVYLRSGTGRLGHPPLMIGALDALAQGRSALSIQRLAALDQALTVWPREAPGASEILRVRDSILLISEGLSQHADYFDSGVVK